ncbi:MAG: adenylyltransferase/cytidyltransferase family protein [Salinispira sp.]
MGTISRGVVIGRFNPPHNGHRYLLNFAQQHVDKLYVFICTLPEDEIPGMLRFVWMQKLVPNAEIIHITEENPHAVRGAPEAVKIWAETILSNMKDGRPDYVFASEDYGQSLARELGALFIEVDSGREQFPVSASAIRSNLLKLLEYWKYIPEPVRVWFHEQLTACENIEKIEDTQN